MKTAMNFTCCILKKESGTVKLLTKEQTPLLSIGGFRFVINGQSVPFDWDDCEGSEENGVFSFETGRGWDKNFELSDCYDRDYEALGLTRDMVDAKFLASADKIEEMHMNFLDEDGNECDFGSNDAEEDFVIQVLSIEFYDIQDGVSYPVAQSVIDTFNAGNAGGNAHE